jgi:hypothetical protein
MAVFDVLSVLQSRITPKFRYSPIIQGLLEIIAAPIQDTIDAVEFILTHLSIDDAEGEQLDLVGGLIGVKRPLKQEDPENLFTLCREGEFDDPDNSTGFCDESDSVVTGGYLTTEEGLASITDPGATMPDADYRRLIRQRAASYRKKMTVENLFTYLLAFGARCAIDDDETYLTQIDPVRYYDLDEWEKWYVVNKGFSPAGLKVRFEEMLRNEESI